MLPADLKVERKLRVQSKVQRRIEMWMCSEVQLETSMDSEFARYPACMPMFVAYSSYFVRTGEVTCISMVHIHIATLTAVLQQCEQRLAASCHGVWICTFFAPFKRLLVDCGPREGDGASQPQQTDLTSSRNARCRGL